MNNSLHIRQQMIGGLWSVRANASHDLDCFSNSLFNQEIHFGEMLTDSKLRLIQLWPSAAYLLAEQPGLPDEANQFTNMITDISHGYCAVNLSGENALTFLGCYCSADLQKATRQCLRTRLGHYPLLIWWDSITEFQLLVERSYAQSFIDYLNLLADRN